MPGSPHDVAAASIGNGHHKRQQHSVKGILLIMLGSFSFSIMFLLVKVLSDMSTFQLVFWRCLIEIGICLVDLRGKGKSPWGPPDARVRFYLVLRGAFGAAAVIAWFFGIQVLPLPDAVTLQFTTPPFAAVFAVCMVGERLRPLDVVGAAVCLSGVALIAHASGGDAGGEGGSGDQQDVSDGDIDIAAGPALRAAAVLVTTAGAAMAGMAYVCVRKIGDRADAVVMVFYFSVISLPMTAIVSKAMLGEWNVLGDVQHFSIVDYFWILLMGFTSYGGQWFTNLGLQNETAATATLATSTQIVWTFIFEILFLHEALNIWSLAGTALILGYMMAVGVMKVIESRKHVDAGPIIVEEGIDEEGILLEPSQSLQHAYGATAGEVAAAPVLLEWQGSKSF